MQIYFVGFLGQWNEVRMRDYLIYLLKGLTSHAPSSSSAPR
jgi:hypothetical protein